MRTCCHWLSSSVSSSTLVLSAVSWRACTSAETKYHTSCKRVVVGEWHGKVWEWVGGSDWEGVLCREGERNGNESMRAGGLVGRRECGWRFGGNRGRRETGNRSTTEMEKADGPSGGDNTSVVPHTHGPSSGEFKIHPLPSTLPFVMLLMLPNAPRAPRAWNRACLM